MGIDFKRAGGRVKKVRRTRPVSNNVYLGVISKLYQFLAKRTESRFNQVVHKRLVASGVNRPVISLRQIARTAKQNPGKVIVAVSDITDDARVENLPKATVCALRFSETARARIVKHGGEAITFDQLALRSPLGSNTVLIRGKKSTREAVKHFGVPGAKHSTAKPYVRSKGNKFEQARGRKKTFRA